MAKSRFQTLEKGSFPLYNVLKRYAALPSANGLVGGGVEGPEGSVIPRHVTPNPAPLKGLQPSPIPVKCSEPLPTTLCSGCSLTILPPMDGPFGYPIVRRRAEAVCPEECLARMLGRVLWRRVGDPPERLAYDQLYCGILLSLTSAY
jgi:hypothetical protein